MRTKLLAMALVSCLELVTVSSSAQAQLFARFGARRWDVGIGSPVYYDGYYGYRYGYYEPGVYTSWGNPYFSNRSYWDGNRYVFPRYEYTGVPISNYFATAAMSPAVVDPSVTVAAIPASDLVAPPAGTIVSQSFYSGPPATADKMQFHVLLPAADAKLFFNDQLVEQQGEDRKLITASAPNEQYHYRVRATWMENGQEKSELHGLDLRPGQMATIQFGAVKERKQ